MSAAALLLIDDGATWIKVNHDDEQARTLADRHYSRQTVGACDFTPPGRKLVLATREGRAVWAAVDNLDPRGGRHWRVTIFRNEAPELYRSSDLVREATATTFAYWRRHYGALPPMPLRTEIDASKVRRKRDPGRCFLRAGWRRVGIGPSRRNLIVLEAVEETGADTGAGPSEGDRRR